MIHRTYPNFVVEELLNNLVIDREDHQFQIKDEKVFQNTLLYIRKSEFTSDELVLKEQRDFLIDLIQQDIDSESLEINGAPKKRFVVDLEIKYIGANRNYPVLSFFIESEKHELNTAENNLIVLRRQERIIKHEETMSWTFPGIVLRVVRLNTLRSPMDVPTRTICGSRVDLDNGSTLVSGGHDVFEFQHWGETKELPEISLKTKKKFRFF